MANLAPILSVFVLPILIRGTVSAGDGVHRLYTYLTEVLN